MAPLLTISSNVVNYNHKDMKHVMMKACPARPDIDVIS